MAYVVFMVMSLMRNGRWMMVDVYDDGWSIMDDGGWRMDDLYWVMYGLTRWTDESVRHFWC